ncbi:MAG: RNA degradosome polyphosphate kinase, partial [Lachnospiraceae bacterium]|nr:RNA degradosome polyphosphate kinase [Lachnospiraceae bacterium]
EERNLENTKKLTAAGAKVLFGRAGIKTHCKLLLIERKEAGGIRRYAHISTGNYNEFTAKSYTDVGLFTASPGICDDVFSLFEYASGKGGFPDLYSLSASSGGLKEEFLRLIDRERTFAEAGKSAKITAKVNSLCDRDIIEALYRAAASGVKVTLIVRGICCLKLDDPRLKDNLTVCSVVGKQLEHSRIFRFENGGNPQIYCSSADWMPRNFEGRIEVLFPIWDKQGQRKLETVLNKLSAPGGDTRMLTGTGEYIYTDKNGASVQEELTGLLGGTD